MEVQIKEGVVFKELNKFILTIIITLMEAGDYIGKTMVITSAADGKHRPDSLHYKNRALDIRTKHLTKGEIEKLLDFLKKKLGQDYDVILEETHIHIEYDPKQV